MFFPKKNKIDNHAKKIDKLVTWLIIWWALASIVGLSKTEKWKKVTKKVTWKSKSIASRWYNLFWKALIKTINIFKKKKNEKK